MKFIDLTGRRFGRLLVLSLSTPTTCARHRSRWLCKCDCGNEVVVRGEGMSCGDTQSCGCFQRESTSRARKTHGRSQSVEYAIWRGIINRCENPKVKAYPYYGGRGIKLRPEWRDFSVFLADMGLRPSPKHSVERKDTDGDYCALNCVWATQQQQSRNKRNNHVIKLQGESLCVVEWAERVGLSQGCILRRLYLGWSNFAAVFTPKYGGSARGLKA